MKSYNEEKNNNINNNFFRNITDNFTIFEPTYKFILKKLRNNQIVYKSFFCTSYRNYFERRMIYINNLEITWYYITIKGIGFL